MSAFYDAPHELYEFSDAGFHRSCYMNWSRREEVERLMEIFAEEYLKTEYFQNMLKIHGPPTYLQDQFVEVIDSFKLSNDKNHSFSQMEEWKTR